MILLPKQKENYPTEPGVYRMMDKQEKIIYIGKAKNLKNRLTTYFDRSKKSPRIQLMVEEIVTIEVTTTATENDALMLEQKLINKIKPKYNIIFRDDKSYPFISLTKHSFPKIYITREKKFDLKKENLFGPYPKREDAYKNVEFVQKIFKLRTCTDNEFLHRSRPCVLHEIGKCSAPCVKKDNPQFVRQYQEDINNAKSLLEGNIKLTISKIKEEMELNATCQDFEAAAKNRDMIVALKGLTDNQNIYSIKEDNGLVFNYVQGERTLLGFAEIVEGVPQKIFNYEVADKFKDFAIDELLERYIDNEILNRGITKIVSPIILPNLFYKYQHTHLDERQKGWLKLVKSNLELIAGETTRRVQNKDQAVTELESIFIPEVVNIDCIDISHFGGEATYGGKIRWKVESDKTGGNLDKSYYRLSRFDDNLIDDVLHMEQTVNKIYHGNEDMPDILIIDGDRPQLDAAFRGLKDKGITKPYILMCSAKGVARKKGDEMFYIHPSSAKLIHSSYLQAELLTLPKDHKVRLLFQNLQDKAHNFSNSAREKRMSKDRFSQKK